MTSLLVRTQWSSDLIQTTYKKVVLLERKRHTARRIASARYAGGGTPCSHGGGVPHPVMVGGIPSSHGGGGVPHPVMVGGTSSSHGGGGLPHTVMVGEYPIQTWPGGTLGTTHHPDLAGGTLGTPHHSDLARGTLGTPTIHTWDGVPPMQTWDGVPPNLGWGTPHHPDLERDIPPSRPGMGYPPVQT